MRLPRGRAAADWSEQGALFTTQDAGLRPNLGVFTAGISSDQLIIDERRRFLRGSRLEESTRASYRAWWATFIGFVKNSEKWHVLLDDDEVPMPVSHRVVEDYVAFLAGGYAHSTLENALGAISEVHRSCGLTSPTTHPCVKGMMSAFLKAQTGTIKKKLTLLPCHARAIQQLEEVWGEQRPDGTRRRWCDLRLARARTAALIGFVAYLRRSEILRLDVCDVRRVRMGFEIHIKRAKNDTEGRGATTLIGGHSGDEAGLIDLIDDYIEFADIGVSRRCTKTANCKVRCTACGFFFPQLGGFPARPVRTAPHRVATSDFVTKDLRTMLWQLQRDAHPAVKGLEVKEASAISLRRGGNSAAAAEGISSTFRRVHGRWRKDTCPDNEYLFLHAKQFAAIASQVLSSTHGE